MWTNYIQPPLPLELSDTNGRVLSDNANSVKVEDRAFHEWYRFVLSYPPHLVREYIHRFSLNPGNVLLDPFCGTGTTLVEAKLGKLHGIGTEANPFPHFASSVKTDWSVSPTEIETAATQVADSAYKMLLEQGLDDNIISQGNSIPLRQLPATAEKALIKNSISPLPLHKTLVLLDNIKAFSNTPFYRYGLLALGKALVTTIGNLKFGPEVGVGKQKQDVAVIAAWLIEIDRIVRDLRSLDDRAFPPTHVHLTDAREIGTILPACSVDAVITSPPYPNEKDYTRTTRLESIILGFAEDIHGVQTVKRQLVRSNTRSVYSTDDDEQWVVSHKEIQRLANEIEQRRIELGKNSGFERQYARVTQLYFGGMARHLAGLRRVLKPGARLAYVVGDQASYLRVMIRTGALLADLAERLDYQVEGIDLFRTRFATATQVDLREEVVVLKWPGFKK
ncbi:DNA methyltransferase [Promineifilum sp.]|uniref:DNA methyltransferase n=1 Tax=Promineifilum sp. TaxID=2664178 RepID=UPI0035AF376B